MKIAILGWGSLLWDRHESFDSQHYEWKYDGPKLKLEFSRISASRNRALTLVIDNEHGESCQVAYCVSKRIELTQTIRDLECREGTITSKIGCWESSDNSNTRIEEEWNSINEWAAKLEFDAVIWTNLKSNFDDFSIQSAINHIQELCPEGKARAAEYIWRAPEFIHTPLRRALEIEPWFKKT